MNQFIAETENGKWLLSEANNLLKYHKEYNRAFVLENNRNTASVVILFKKDSDGTTETRFTEWQGNVPKYAIKWTNKYLHNQQD